MKRINAQTPNSTVPGSATDDAGKGGGAPPPEHSETNNQVEGVHEADIVKTDGNYLYTADGKRLLDFQSQLVSDNMGHRHPRVHAEIKMNFLASPPLVVAYAIAGTMDIDLTTAAIGQDKNGNDVFLKDIWPTDKEVADTIAQCLTPEMYRQRYSNVESIRIAGQYRDGI